MDDKHCAECARLRAILATAQPLRLGWSLMGERPGRLAEEYRQYREHRDQWHPERRYDNRSLFG